MGEPMVCGELPCAGSALDQERDEILERVREFRTAVDRGKPRADLQRLLDDFSGVIGRHFAAEEELMNSSGYGDSRNHAAEHQHLLAQLEIVRQDLASGAISLGGALALFLQVSTERHIQGPDKLFAEFWKMAAATAA